jgi:hypothetical protein
VRLEVAGQVVLRITPAQGPLNVDLAAPDRVPQGHQDAQLVRDALDLALVVDDSLAPVLAYDAVHRHLLIARDRHAASSFSEQSANSPAGSPSLRTSFSLVISVSSESRPTAPGSRLSEASRAAPSSLSSATRSQSPSTSVQHATTSSGDHS